MQEKKKKSDIMASHINNKLISFTISVRDEIKFTPGNEVLQFTNALSPLEFRIHTHLFMKYNIFLLYEKIFI